MQTSIDSIHAVALPPTQPTSSPHPPPSPNPLPAVTPQLVHQLFPSTPLANIAANLPHVLAALTAASLADIPMLLMALATIRAEAEPFLPLTEQPSPLNTSPGSHPGAVSGHPFDLYDHRRDLGNLGPPDGALYRGRGFVQLTGRANYARYAKEIAQPLLTDPDLAATPAIAAQLLARFLANREPEIRRALASNNLALARRLVNGGSNGLERFTAAYTAGAWLLRI